MSRTSSQAIIIPILPNISRSKCNQIIKFGQLIEYNKKYVLFQKSCKKLSMETSSRPLFVSFEKALYMLKDLLLCNFLHDFRSAA